jgi:ankyrin repeat protein
MGTAVDKKLFSAIEKNSLNDVRKALASGADINAVREKNNGMGKDTPVFAALYNSGTSVEILKLLLGAGADINRICTACYIKRPWREKKYRNSTPLLEAVSENSEELVKLLLESGADPNLQLYDVNEDAESMPLFQAVKYGRYSIAKMLLANGAKTDPFGAYMLCLALRDTNPLKPSLRKSMISLLNEHGAAVDNIEKIYGYKKSPLRTVLKMGDVETARLFLTRVEKGDAKLLNSPTVLFEDAVRSGSVEMVRFVLSMGIVPEESDPAYSEVLWGAFQLDDSSMVEFLFPEILSPNPQKTMPNGKTLLQNAMDAGIRETMGEKFCHLLKAGANPNQTSDTGLSPMLHALYSSNFEAAEILLRHGVQVNERQNVSGMTLLMYCHAKDQLDFLLGNGADVDIQDNDGKTALMHVLNNTHFSFELVPELIRAGARADIEDKDGNKLVSYIISGFEKVFLENSGSMTLTEIEKWLGAFSSAVFSPGGFMSEDVEFVASKLRYINQLYCSKQKYVTGAFFIAAAAALLPERNSLIDASISSTLVNSFKLFLDMHKLPPFLTRQKLLAVVSGGKKGSMSLNHAQSGKVVEMLLETLETHPGTVIDFIKKRIGKNLDTWNRDGVRGVSELLARVSPLLFNPERDVFFAGDIGDMLF